MYITRKHFTVLMLALLMLLLTLPVMALGEADTAVEQEVLVPNTPIRGMIQLEKRGAVLKSFIESQDPFGYTIHTPIYEDGSLAGAVYEVRAAEDVIGKEGTVWFKANELVTTITTTSEEISESELLRLHEFVLCLYTDFDNRRAVVRSGQNDIVVGFIQNISGRCGYLGDNVMPQGKKLRFADFLRGSRDGCYQLIGLEPDRSLLADL